MKGFTKLAHAAVIAATLFGATAALADPTPFTSFLTAADPLQKGRLSRNGIPQDESGGLPGIEAYPGVINPTLSYHYHVYSFTTNSVDSLIYITINSLSTNTFVAAYQSAYYVTNPATSWLGDPGTSANYFEVGSNPGSLSDPLSFNFLAAANSQVLLVVNETTPNAGLGSTMPFTLLAQGFAPDFSDLGVDYVITSGGQVIPEPSTLLMLAPLALVAGLKTRRRRAAVPA